MIKNLINFLKKLFEKRKRKEDVCINSKIDCNVDINKEVELKKEIGVEKEEKILEGISSEKALILTNGVAIGESFINDGKLTAVERNYLMIMICRFNLTEGYSEVSINEFLKFTNTTNRGNVIKVLERLENKNVIKKIKGDANDSNRFLILKHMLIIGDRSIKYDTSNINVTSNINISDEIEYKDIIFKEINENKNLNDKYAAMILRDTCFKNVEELTIIRDGYNELKIIADEFIEKIES